MELADRHNVIVRILLLDLKPLKTHECWHHLLARHEEQRDCDRAGADQR